MPFTPQQIQHAGGSGSACGRSRSSTENSSDRRARNWQIFLYRRARLLVAPRRVSLLNTSLSCHLREPPRVTYAAESQRYCAAAGVINGAQVGVLRHFTRSPCASYALRGCCRHTPLTRWSWINGSFEISLTRNSLARAAIREGVARRSAVNTKRSGVPANGDRRTISLQIRLSVRVSVRASTRSMAHALKRIPASCRGEIVRQCVTRITAGTLDPVAQLHVEHLIADEFQDLNPIDLEFVDSMIQGGVITFAAGDDDQSIYSFRFASPTGNSDVRGHIRRGSAYGGRVLSMHAGRGCRQRRR